MVCLLYWSWTKSPFKNVFRPWPVLHYEVFKVPAVGSPDSSFIIALLPVHVKHFLKLFSKFFELAIPSPMHSPHIRNTRKCRKVRTLRPESRPLFGDDKIELYALSRHLSTTFFSFFDFFISLWFSLQNSTKIRVSPSSSHLLHCGKFLLLYSSFSSGSAS